METKVILSLSEEDAKHAFFGLPLIDKTIAGDTGYAIQCMIEEAAKNPIEIKLNYVGYISDAINESLSFETYKKERELRKQGEIEKAILLLSEV